MTTMAALATRTEKGAPEALARFGFFARGVVYVLVGLIAARVVLAQRGRATGPSGALEKTLIGWQGTLVLCVIVAGLLALVLFRLAQCVRTKRPFARIGYAASALCNLVLAIASVRILLHLRATGGASTLREAGLHLVANAWARRGLELGGAIAIVAGSVEAVRAALGRLPEDFVAPIMARDRRKWTSLLAQVGVFAHGFVVAITGYFVSRAGFDANARELNGTEAAIRSLRHVDSGPFVLGVVAAGLLAYGFSQLVLAAHRRRRSP